MKAPCDQRRDKIDLSLVSLHEMRRGRRSDAGQDHASGCASKKVVKPVRRREIIRHLQTAYEVSERKACGATGFGRAPHRYTSRCDPQVGLRMRLKELAEARVRYGYRRLHVLLQREGWQANHKKIYRLYSEEGLSIRTRSPRRRRACLYRSSRAVADGMNDVWAMDFVSDKLFDGCPFRVLTIVDCYTREALSTAPRTNFRAYQVLEELDRLARLRGKPRSLRVDNGPEFAGRATRPVGLSEQGGTGLLAPRETNG